MCTQGITINPAEARKRLPAREPYDAFHAAVDVVEELTVEERIDCDLHRVGRPGVAFKPQHFASMRVRQRGPAGDFGHDTGLLTKSDLRAEQGSYQDPSSEGSCPEQERRHTDRRFVGGGGLVVSGGYAAEVLRKVEAPLTVLRRR